MTRERGSGITPPRVVVLLKEQVSEKSILAVSRSTGIGLAAISRYLKGVGEPTTATLKKLAAYFNVSVEYLRKESPIVAPESELQAIIDFHGQDPIESFWDVLRNENEYFEECLSLYSEEDQKKVSRQLLLILEDHIEKTCEKIKLEKI